MVYFSSISDHKKEETNLAQNLSNQIVNLEAEKKRTFISIGLVKLSHTHIHIHTGVNANGVTTKYVGASACPTLPPPQEQG